MCLLSHSYFGRIARHNIPIVKLLNVRDDILIAPCVNHVFGKITDLPLVLIPNNSIPNIEVNTILGIFPIFSIGRGFIHCFDASKIDNSIAFYWGTFPGSIFKYFNGYIPKGTHYFIGSNGDLCAEKVVLLEESKIY